MIKQEIKIQHSNSVIGRMKEDSFKWLLTDVYGTNENS